MSEIYDFKIKTREGKIVKRFAPTTNPDEIEENIKELL
jgi:glutathione peroxidase-family protein